MEGGTAEDVTEPRWSREEVDLSTAPVFLSLVFSSVTGLSDVGSLFDSLTVNVWMTWRKKQKQQQHLPCLGRQSKEREDDRFLEGEVLFRICAG